MWIEPNTNIWILKDVPLDTTYDHTIYFADAPSQYNYFSSKAKYTLTQQSYQRVQRGYMRVKIKAESLYDCNYLMFQNLAFGLKWFYAFIKSVEYINNEVSEIQFELDVMQTWFFEYTLDECFVEREHSISDKLFENLVPENLDLGDGYVCVNEPNEDVSVSGATKISFDYTYLTIISSNTYDSSTQTLSGSMIKGIYTPLKIEVLQYALSPDEDLSNRINQDLVSKYYKDGKSDDIIAMFQSPINYVNDNLGARSRTIKMNVDTIDGYTPKNKKLFNYPYNMFYVSNNAGSVSEFHYEDFKQSTHLTNVPAVDFEYVFSILPTPSVFLYPVNHRNVAKDFDNGLTLTNFPQVVWVRDAYTDWYNTNKNSIVLSHISTSLSSQMGITQGAVMGLLAGSKVGLAGAVIGGLSGGVISPALEIASTLTKREDLKTYPANLQGQLNNGYTNTELKRYAFNFYKMSIKHGTAKIIDDYFSRYGYATRTNKTPNRNVRPHWTYTKTVGCTISGSIPCDDMNKICSIYNNGITFWKNGDEVGNYSLNNSPET